MIPAVDAALVSPSYESAPLEASTSSPTAGAPKPNWAGPASEAPRSRASGVGKAGAGRGERSEQETGGERGGAGCTQRKALGEKERSHRVLTICFSRGRQLRQGSFVLDMQKHVPPDTILTLPVSRHPERSRGIPSRNLQGNFHGILRLRCASLRMTSKIVPLPCVICFVLFALQIPFVLRSSIAECPAFPAGCCNRSARLRPRSRD